MCWDQIGDEGRSARSLVEGTRGEGEGDWVEVGLGTYPAMIGLGDL